MTTAIDEAADRIRRAELTLTEAQLSHQAAVRRYATVVAAAERDLAALRAELDGTGGGN